MRWTKSKIGNEVSNTAIMCNNYHIARCITYIDGQRKERFSLFNCETKEHKFIAWFDSAQEAKQYVINLIGVKNANT